MSAILPGLQRVLGGMSSRRRASVRRIGMLLVWAALLAVVQSNLPHADVAHAQDRTAPEVQGTPYLQDTELSVIYTERLDQNSTPGTDAFTVTVDSNDVEIGSVYISSAQLTLLLASPVYQGQTVTMSYRVPTTNPIRDEAENNAPAFTGVAVNNASSPRPTDMTPPERSGTPVVDEGLMGESVLTITYNERLDPVSPPTSAFTVTVDGDEVDLDWVQLSSTTVSLYLASNTYAGQSVTVSYAVPATSPVRDRALNPAPAFSGVAVTNNSNPPPPTPTTDNTPPQLSEEPDGGISVRGTQLTLVYNENLDSNSTRIRPITRSVPMVST